MPELEQTSVRFTPPLVDLTGKIGDVLVDLMGDQIATVQKEVRNEFSAQKAPADTVKNLLENFVTLEGTKRPISREELLQIPDLTPEVIRFALAQLIQVRLIREYEEGMYELAHDTLAAHLATLRDPEEVAMLEAVELVQNGYANHLKTRRSYLPDEELYQVGKYEERIRNSTRLSKEEWTYVEKSRRWSNRKVWIRRGVFTFFVLLSIGLGYTAWSINERNLEIERLLGENGILVSDLEKQSKFNKLTANALKNSRSDRTSAFRQLREVLDSMGNHELAPQIKRDLLAEFPLYPFYQQSEQAPEALQKILVEDSLKFLISLGNSSPRVDFWSFRLDERKLKSSLREQNLLFEPKDFGRYGIVEDLVMIGDGRKIITAHEDGKIWEWTLEQDTPRLVHTFEGYVNKLAPFGKDVLVGVDSLVYELHLDGRKYPAEFKIGFNRSVRLLVADPSGSGNFAVVKENANKIYLCNRNTGTAILQTFEVDPDAVTCLAFSPNGRQMAAAFEGDIAKLWSLNRPDILTLFRGHDALISTLVFSPDGRNLLTGSWDRTAILWKTNGEMIKKLVGHRQRIHSIAYTDDNFGVTCSEDGEIKIWNLAPLSEKSLLLPDRVRALAVSPKYNQVAVSCFGERGFLHLWDWTTGRETLIRQPLNAGDQAGDIVALAFTADGTGLVAGSQNNLVSLIDLSGGKPNEDYRSSSSGRMPPTDAITSVDVNDQYILISNRSPGNNMALLRKRRDPKFGFIVLPHTAGVNTARFSPDGQFVLTGCDDGRAYLWNVKEKKLVETLSGHSSRVAAVAFSQPDGQFILTGSYDNTALLWHRDEKTGLFADKPPRSLEGITDYFSGHTSDVKAVAFAQQNVKGNYKFLTASADKTVKILQLSNGQLIELPSLIRHFDEIRGAGFSPDGQFIITGSDDRSVRVWRAGDVETIIEEKVLTGAKR